MSEPQAYRVGDKVIIRNDLGDKDDHGPGLDGPMVDLGGNECTVTHLGDRCNCGGRIILLDGEGEGWSWCSSWVEPALDLSTLVEFSWE